MKSKLRVGVIGVGSVVREIYRHLYFNSEFSHLLEIVAVADPNDEFRNWFCDTFDIPPERRFAGHPEMLAKVELDAVQVNTPDNIHRDPAVDALEAGMDVVVAKPIASTTEGVERLSGKPAVTNGIISGRPTHIDSRKAVARRLGDFFS